MRSIGVNHHPMSTSRSFRIITHHVFRSLFHLTGCLSCMSVHPPSHTCLSITCPFSPITDLHTCPILTVGCNPHCSCYTWEKHRGYQQVWTLPTPYMGHFTIANRFESYGNYVNDVHIQASSMMTHSISLRPHTIPCPGVALIFVVSANLNYPW